MEINILIAVVLFLLSYAFITLARYMDAKEKLQKLDVERDIQRDNLRRKAQNKYNLMYHPWDWDFDKED